MTILLRQATIVDPSSPFHLHKSDIFIKDGFIHSITNNLNEKADKIIDIDGLHVSPGWVDVFSHFNDPGFEYKETLESGAAAAAAGGYTDVMVIPNTDPCIHNKSGVEYVTHKSISVVSNIHPIGAITKNTEGKELTEMYDMAQSGAVAFSDGLHAVQSPGVMLKALQYLKSSGKTIIQLPDDRSIHPSGLMHEGVVSTTLGLPGKPAIAEEIIIDRDIELLKYTGASLHLTGVSTKRALDKIRKAKSEGLNITCSVSPYHLVFTDEDLKNYDTNLKVNPPLRSAADKQALIEAILDGTVDCIATHHLPHEKDSKVVEFEYAKHGMIGLQTTFSLINTVINNLDLSRLVELMSINAREIFSLPPVVVDKNSTATLSLFLTDSEYIFDKGLNKSKSFNSPLFGVKLKGQPLGIINKDKLFLN